ncbi:sugar ABC transporter permease [Nonomuraea sp. PA05]|uniref:ABC transporter permease n=1 Tax=Nonomuraea sp. PA05 TaxID=2604466 RepID=UPI0011DAA485|nr:ABC transporter permease subunit [Nonomuraea sp. PA05]TYB70329.1 sugar ABC transporter permease [Nonomuraea sp. PA05]
MATDLATPPKAAPKAKKPKRADKVPLGTAVLRYRWLYLMLLPGVAYFVIFKYLPMYGVTIAFQDYLPFLGYSGSPWVGLKHFEQLFSGPDFARLLANTLILAALHIMFVFTAPVIVALMLNELRVNILKRSIQSLIYIPHFLSWTIVAALTYVLFAADFGVIAAWMRDLLGDTTKIDYMAQEQWFREIVILQQLWKMTGWGTIIYLAALAGVDPNLYEAARMDGAGRSRQLWHVTLPAIRPTVVVMAILASGNLLDSGFEQIWLMTTSLNREVAEVFDTYVYYAGVQNGNFSYSTAVGLFKGVAGVILIFGSNWLAKRMGQRGLF